MRKSKIDFKMFANFEESRKASPFPGTGNLGFSYTRPEIVFESILGLVLFILLILAEKQWHKAIANFGLKQTFVVVVAVPGTTNYN